MPSQKNINQLKILKEKLQQSKAVVLADYAGLSVKKQTELREKISQAGGQFLVAKNRIFKLALKENKLDFQDLDEALMGTTALLFTYEDEISPLKALIEFSKTNDLPKTKIGLILKPEDRILTIEEIQNLANLPSKNELVAKLISSLSSPQYRLINSLKGNLIKLILSLKSLKDSKQSN